MVANIGVDTAKYDISKIHQKAFEAGREKKNKRNQ